MAKPPIPVRVRAAVVDLGAARRYLSAVSRMCAEGARSSEPQVILLALEVLVQQPPAARRLLGRAA